MHYVLDYYLGNSLGCTEPDRLFGNQQAMFSKLMLSNELINSVECFDHKDKNIDPG